MANTTKPEAVTLHRASLEDLRKMTTDELHAEWRKAVWYVATAEGYERAVAGVYLEASRKAKAKVDVPSDREEMLSVLRAVEWGGALDGGLMGQCPVCLGRKPSPGVEGCGHAPDCRLVKLIGG